MSLTTAFEFDKIVLSVLSVWSEDEGDEIAFMDVTTVRMPFPAAGTIWDIQPRWEQFSEVFTARRDAAWEDFEQEYVERRLLPAWVEEDDILMLPATAIVAAHEAGVKAFTESLRDDATHAFYDEADYDIQTARKMAREAVIASIKESLATAKAAV